MARITRIERRKSIQPQRTAAKADPQAFGQQGRNMQQFGEIALAAEENFRNLHNANQVLKAKNQAREQIQKIKEAAAQDADPFTVNERVAPQINDIGGALMESISDPASRLEFKSFFNATSFNARTNIRQQSRTRQIEYQQAELFDSVDKTVQQYYESVNIDERKMLKQSLGMEFDKAKARLWMDPVAAQKYEQATYEKMRKGQVYFDLANSPTELVIQHLEAGKQGRYADLLPEERVDMIAEAQKLQARNEKLAASRVSRAQEENTRNVWVDMLTPGSRYKLDDAIQQFSVGEIDETQFQKIRKFLTSDKTVDPAVNLQSYSEIRDLQTGEDARGKRWSKSEIDAKIQELAADGKLSHTDAKGLLEKTYQPVTGRRDNLININKKGLQAGLEKMMLDPSRSFMEESGVTRAKIDEYMYRFDKQVEEEQAEGERIEEIMQEVADAAVRDTYPELQGQKDLVDVVVSVDKSVKRIPGIRDWKKDKPKAEFVLRRADTE